MVLVHSPNGHNGVAFKPEHRYLALGTLSLLFLSPVGHHGSSWIRPPASRSPAFPHHRKLATHTKHSTMARLSRALQEIRHVLDFGASLHDAEISANVLFSPGSMISLTVFGRTLIVINDAETAIELLEKRAAQYSSRPGSILVNA